MIDTPERFGPYELTSLLGRGGMGEVYRAYDTVRRRTVALKRLPRHLAGDRDFEIRFRREAEVAARLTEPHIIPIHDYGDIDGQLYIDMRLITGTDLGDVIRDAGPLPAARAAAIVGQVATALAAAHAEGLVHRDVKPSNVLISTTDRGEDFVHLVDFGIVHDQNSTGLTATGSTIGTLDYMAPERLEQQSCDHRADVYSLGCVLFEALTGRKPFVAGTTAAKMFAHMHTPPPRPSEVRPDIPPGLDNVVLRAMAKKPSERYASTTELATDMYRSLSGAPPQGQGAAPPHGPTATGTAGYTPPGYTPPGYGATGYGAVPTGQGSAPTASPFSASRTSFGPPPQTAAQPPAPTRTTAAMNPAMPTYQPPTYQPPQQQSPYQSPPQQPWAGEPTRRAPRRTVPIVAAVVVLAVVATIVVFMRSGTTQNTSTAASATPTASSVTKAPATRAQTGGGAGQAPAAPTLGAPPPAAAAGATTITGKDGARTVVTTSSLQLCNGDGVPLASGVQVPTGSISRLDVTLVGTVGISVTITQTNGQKVDGQVNTGCSVAAQSNIGPFSLDLSRIRSVEINR